jgi:hypothetical protein
MKQVYGLIFGNLARALRRSNLHGATAVGGRYCLVRGRGDWDLTVWRLWSGHAREKRECVCGRRGRRSTSRPPRPLERSSMVRASTLLRSRRIAHIDRRHAGCGHDHRLPASPPARPPAQYRMP